MSGFFQNFWGAFLGKVAAAIFIAACIALGVGPDEWAEFMIQNLPIWITPSIAQRTFIVLGLIVIFFIASPFSPRTSTTNTLGDIAIADAIDYLVNDSTAKLEQPKTATEDGVHILEEGVEHCEAIRIIQNAATNGFISIWGCREKAPGSQIWETTVRQIPKDYWEKAELDWHAPLFKNHNEPQTRPIDPNEWRQSDIRQYCNLLLNKSQLYSMWPKKRWFKRQWQNFTKGRIQYPRERSDNFTS